MTARKTTPDEPVVASPEFSLDSAIASGTTVKGEVNRKRGPNPFDAILQQLWTDDAKHVLHGVPEAEVKKVVAKARSSANRLGYGLAVGTGDPVDGLVEVEIKPVPKRPAPEPAADHEPNGGSPYDESEEDSYSEE